MKRIFALALITVLLLSACQPAATGGGAADDGGAAAGGGGPAAGGGGAVQAPVREVIQLEYWFEGAGPERTPTHMAIIDGFNAQSDYIQVTGVYVDLTTGLEMVNVAFAGNMLPDVVHIGDSWAASVIAQGMAVQIDDWFNEWEDSEQFTAAALARVRMFDPQGRMFYVPTASNITGIWYRTDVFAEHGLEPPTTWDNFFHAVEYLTDPAEAIWGHTLRGGAGSTIALMNMIVNYTGGPFWDETGTVAQMMRSEEAARFVERFASIFQNGWAPESSLTAGFNEMVADFNAELAMTLIHNLGSYENQRQTFEPHQFSFRPFPPSPVIGMQAEQVATAKGLMISVNSNHPEEAWEYIKWNTSREAISAINQAVGELPTRYDSLSDPWVANATHMRHLPEYAATPKVTIAIPNYLPDYNRHNREFAEPNFQAVLVGQMSAHDFLHQWADRIEEANRDFRAAHS